MSVDFNEIFGDAAARISKVAESKPKKELYAACLDAAGKAKAKMYQAYHDEVVSKGDTFGKRHSAAATAYQSDVSTATTGFHSSINADKDLGAVGKAVVKAVSTPVNLGLGMLKGWS